jgi:two-component system, response regulator PdtaR
VPQAITVLVVEDEALIRMDIADQLERMGFAVLEAANAREAIDMLASHPAVQVLFTDVDMPGGVDGLKLAVAVRDRWPPIKIIVTSGHRKVAMKDLPDDSLFFAKPYQGSAVASAMRGMLGR